MHRPLRPPKVAKRVSGPTTALRDSRACLKLFEDEVTICADAFANHSLTPAELPLIDPSNADMSQRERQAYLEIKGSENSPPMDPLKESTFAPNLDLIYDFTK